MCAAEDLTRDSSVASSGDEEDEAATADAEAHVMLHVLPTRHAHIALYWSSCSWLQLVIHC